MTTSEFWKKWSSLSKEWQGIAGVECWIVGTDKYYQIDARNKIMCMTPRTEGRSGNGNMGTVWKSANGELAYLDREIAYGRAQIQARRYSGLHGGEVVTVLMPAHGFPLEIDD